MRANMGRKLKQYLIPSLCRQQNQVKYEVTSRNRR